MGIGPYEKERKLHRPPGPAAQSERLRRGWEEGAGIAAEIIPKGASNLGQSLSQPAADSSLYTREPWGTGVTDCHVALLLAMTVLILCHSEEAQRADVGIRPFYDGRGFGPPHERRGERHAESSCPTESPINHPSQPARNEASAPAGRGMGGNRRKDHPKRGTAPRPPGQRLAKRKARKEELVKFDFCPTTSECSTAYNVRKSQQSPARAHAEATSTE